MTQRYIYLHADDEDLRAGIYPPRSVACYDSSGKLIAIWHGDKWISAQDPKIVSYDYMYYHD